MGARWRWHRGNLFPASGPQWALGFGAPARCAGGCGRCSFVRAGPRGALCACARRGDGARDWAGCEGNPRREGAAGVRMETVLAAAAG